MQFKLWPKFKIKQRATYLSYYVSFISFRLNSSRRKTRDNSHLEEDSNPFITYFVCMCMQILINFHSMERAAEYIYLLFIILFKLNLLYIITCIIKA